MSEFTWSYEPVSRRYVIRRGGWVYQEIMVNRHNPAHTRRYVERSVAILNGENA